MKRNEAIRLRRMIEHGSKKLSDKEVSSAPLMLPRMRYNGSLITAGTRIMWEGAVKCAAVDVWDTKENAPDVAPDLWRDIEYINGIRKIPENIYVTNPFSKDEEGIDSDGNVWISRFDNNVYTPAQYPNNWDLKSKD